MESIKQLLIRLTGKKNVYIVRRGNVAIREALRIAKEKGFSKVALQDQGGWITYKQYVKKLKLDIKVIKTDYGIVKGNFNDCILLINTMPGYAALQDVDDINATNCFVINDASGSIGRDSAIWGDIILGSFGKDKPVDLEKGGFIATNLEIDVEEEKLNTKERNILREKLEGLYRKIEKFTKIRSKIINELHQYEVVHPDKEGFNVIVRTRKEKDKQEVVNYCKKHGYEYTECPRYIRINDDGISIEVKRIS